MYNILYGNQKNINLLVSFGVFSFEYHFENRKNELKRVGEVIPFFKSVFRNTKKTDLNSAGASDQKRHKAYRIAAIVHNARLKPKSLFFESHAVVDKRWTRLGYMFKTR